MSDKKTIVPVIINNSYKIKKYKGTKDVEKWFTEYELIAKANGWNEGTQRKTAPLYYRDKAKRWFENNQDDLKNYTRLKSATIFRFQERKTSRQVLASFLNIKKRRTENVRDYADRFDMTKRKYEAWMKSKNQETMFSKEDVAQLFVRSL
jgi:hypothetical protein